MPAELEAALERLYGREGAEAGAAAPAPSHAGSHEEDLQRLKDLASEAPVIRLVNQLVARAVECRASDIHFETFRAGMQVRYRVDGTEVARARTAVARPDVKQLFGFAPANSGFQVDLDVPAGNRDICVDLVESGGRIRSLGCRSVDVT